MRARAFCGAFALTLGLASAAPAADLPLILRSTTPAGHVMLSFSPELLWGDDRIPAWSRNSRLVSSLIPDVAIGITDRLQVNALPLGVAYRLGDPNATEFIPAFSLNPSGSHSPTQGASVYLNPLLSVDARQWIIPGNSVTLGVMTSPVLGWIEGCDPFGRGCSPRVDAFSNWFFAGQGGIAQTFGRVTISIGATVQYTFSAAQTGQDTAAFTIGSRVRHGISSDPTVRVHITDFVSVDGHLEYTRNITRGFGVGVASLGVNAIF